MFGRFIVSVFLVLCVFTAPVFAADVKQKYSIEEAMNQPKISSALEGDVVFYWGDQAHPAVSKTHGSFKTSKRTRAFGKSRADACSWAMASALVVLRDRAYKEGGNAVINIVSNIKNHEESSSANYSCLAGTMVVNVALKGTVVTLAQ